MERELLIRARGGDLEAFGDLIRLHQARLRSFVARYVESSHDVYDIVQDAWLDALKNLDSFDLDRELLPWLRALCRNRMLNYFRARRVRRNAPQALVDAAIEGLSQAGEPEEIDLERIEALRKCLENLSPAERQMLDRRYTQSTPVKDIAAQLNRSAASISMQLRRIRVALFECVGRRLRLAE